jgi:hypothetical protein
MTPEETPDQDERLALDALEALRHFDWSSRRPSRGAVDTIWRAIAGGLLSDEDTARWARSIAQDVVEYVIADTSSDRSERALKALKLSGKAEAGFSEHAALKSALAIPRLVATLTGKPFVVPTPAQAAEILHKEGSYVGVPRKAANDRAGRVLKKVLAKWVGPERKK